MIHWDFYSKRRNVSLENFLEGITTLSGAIDFFKQKKIHPPESLKEFYNKVDVVEPTPTPPVKKPTSTPRKKPPAKTTKTTRTRRKAAPKKKEEPVQEASQEQTVETKDEKKQYFRKIIKPEKK